MTKKKKTIRIRSDSKGIKKVAEYNEFIQFMALPTIFRKKEYGFDTLKEFAQENKVDPDTLTNWKKTEGFWDAVRQVTKDWGKGKTPDVILSLYKNILHTGRAADVLAWMKIVEDWVETTKVQNEEIVDPTKELAKLLSK